MVSSRQWNYETIIVGGVIRVRIVRLRVRSRSSEKRLILPYRLRQNKWTKNPLFAVLLTYVWVNIAGNKFRFSSLAFHMFGTNSNSFYSDTIKLPQISVLFRLWHQTPSSRDFRNTVEPICIHSKIGEVKRSADTPLQKETRKNANDLPQVDHHHFPRMIFTSKFMLWCKIASMLRRSVTTLEHLVGLQMKKFCAKDHY